VIITVEVREARTHLTDLLARVEAGERIVVARGNRPVARVIPIGKAKDLAEVVTETRAARDRAKPVRREEVVARRREGGRGA